MTFLGFLTLFDPPKVNITDTIASLKKLGVSLKVITGDNYLVTARLGKKWDCSILLPIAVITLILTFTPFGHVFGFSPLSLSTCLLLLLIVVVYIIAAEVTKTIFYKKVKFKFPYRKMTGLYSMYPYSSFIRK
jgi:magnesium-transporting ATPase (P-type)